MGLLNIFSGNSHQGHERKGDSFFRSGAYGDAKLEYESALYKLKKKDPNYSRSKDRLVRKISESRENLARNHIKKGEELLGLGDLAEAKDLFDLACELTDRQRIKEEAQARIQEIVNLEVKQLATKYSELPADYVDNPEQEELLYDDEYFTALCGSFTDKEREQAYHSYGESFRQGYVALNQGDFELAQIKLSQALQENPSPDTYIPLELATAYANLGKNEEVKQLLIPFLDEHPDSFQAYQVLCETLWDMKEHDRALEILEACSPEFRESSQIRYLEGETLFHAGKYGEAKRVYEECLESEGWIDEIAISLARTLDTLEEKEEALDLYGEIISQCVSCGRLIAPDIKRRYADISFEFGRYTTETLEIYLSLVQENPDNKKEYYQRISDIYSAQGYDDEARRFQSFADQSDL